MATTTKQDSAFIVAISNPGSLQDAIDWMQENMSPEDVFSKDQLVGWAEENDYQELRTVEALEEENETLLDELSELKQELAEQAEPTA